MSGECGGRICGATTTATTNDKSDTRGQVTVTEATVISLSSSSPSNLGLQKEVASVNQLTLVVNNELKNKQLQLQQQQQYKIAAQQVKQLNKPEQLSTLLISQLTGGGGGGVAIAAAAAATVNNGSSSIACTSPCSTIATLTRQNCNICHQDILATSTLQQIKPSNHNSHSIIGAVERKPDSSSVQIEQQQVVDSQLTSNQLISGTYCSNCLNSNKQQPVNEPLEYLEQSNSSLNNNSNNNSFLFWKFLSNLPRSINQRSKSVNSSTLTPEVAGYLASKRLCNLDSEIINEHIMSSTTAATIAANSNSYQMQLADEPKIFNNNIKMIKQTNATKSTREPPIAAAAAAAAATVVDCHLVRGDEHKLINIVVPVATANSSSGEQVAAQESTTLHLQHQQTDFIINNNNNNDQKQQQHLGSQIKLSIATTTTATRSSASSLSSCILSDSTSTSEVRLKWGKKMDFLLSIIGFAVDLANIWRFPYLVYKNGGGVFLIPYVTMLIFGGIPLFFLELCLGQYVKKGPITVWNKICPAMKGVGYCSIMISCLLSFGEKMPWEECDNSWNSNATCVSISQLKNTCAARNEPLDTCRKSMYAANVTSPASEFFVKELSQIDQSSGLEDMGHLRMELVICLVIVYLLHYFSLFRGLETSGKVVWVTATAPYMILSILLVRGLFLPGASMGIEYYLSPKLERLHDPQVWIDAAGQVFYSIGVGFGVHLTYASFNSHNNNCYRDCLMTSAVNVITSVYSGLVVFVYLGYMASNLGIEIDKVANEGYSLVFEVYPEALTTLPFARFWSILFFIMLLTLGIDSAMGGLEAVITGLEDEFKFAKRLSRGQLTGLVIVSSFLPALISCTQGGAYTLYWFDIYSAGISLLFAALFETIGVVYCYGLKKFIANIESMLGRGPHIFFILCWKYISPLFLGGVIFMQIYTASKITYRNYTYPVWSIILGWCLAFSSVAAIPIVAFCYWYNHRFRKAIPDKSIRKRGASSVASSSRHGSSKKSPNHHRSVSQVSYNGQNPGGGGGGSIHTTLLTKQQPDQQNPYTKHHQMVAACDTISSKTREEML